MPKERSINPVAAQHKADKQKALNKNKKNVQAQRNEKLARRNPERLQKQIDELKDLESNGTLRPKDKETLTQLEKDLRGVRRARDALGDAAPKFAERRDYGGDARQEQRERRQGLGKRRRGEEDAHNSGEETDPEVRSIPMPRDTPPPIPNQPRQAHALPEKPTPAAPAQTVYSSAPVLRDLKKEAVRFMPSAVAAKKARMKGQGGKLLEPEEADRLEKEGYFAAQKAAEAGEKEERFRQLEKEAKAPVQGQDIDMEEETRRFEMEMTDLIGEPPSQQDGRKTVQMEDVQDDGD